MRCLTLDEISTMEQAGCRATDWRQVVVADAFDADAIRCVSFQGEVHIGSGVRLERIGLVATASGATFGQGVAVHVKRESGPAAVVMHSDLTAHTAALMMQAAEAGDTPLLQALLALARQHAAELTPPCTTIADGVVATDCRTLTNVCLGRDCEVTGATRLTDCTLAPAVFVGDRVIMDSVIVQAGASVSDGAMLYDTLVGEATHIARGFTADSSLFFANSHMECGEAMAALCGPFSASHHKATLLIGAQVSFYNAGSATNFSNHAYKMGPIHYGTLCRGTKTASGAHILWPATIGAYSMVMGRVATHPDTRPFPFSYVIGDGHHTYLVPGRNITTAGTYRDVHKWPRRGQATAALITHDWLSPYVIAQVKEGRRLLQALPREQGADQEEYHTHGCIIRATALRHAIVYYDLALAMYTGAAGTGEWTDLLGLLLPNDALDQLTADLLDGDIDTVPALEARFRDIYDSYQQWRGSAASDAAAEEATRRWQAAVKRDAEREYDLGDVTDEQLREFLDTIE